MPSPLRNAVTHLPKPESQSCSLISSPEGWNQAMSGNGSAPRRRGRIGLPAKNRRRRNTGWALRSATTPAVNPTRPAFLVASDQSTHEIGLSWQ
jgi:hypothetical protein